MSRRAAALLIRGDARALPLTDQSVQCVVTSPPYWGLRDYGRRAQLGLESTPDAYVAALVAVFREVRRVLKDDGTVWLNLGDCYATGAGSVGEHPGGGGQGERWKGYRGTQPVQTKDRTGGKRDNLKAVGPMTQPNRMPIVGLKSKDLVMIPARVALALQADGWYLRSDIIWHKPNPMPESVTDRPTKAHEHLFLLTKSERYYYNATAINEPFVSGRTLRPSEKRRNKRSVWTIATRAYKGAHFATMPELLVEPCILAGSKRGSVCLDPFVGSGTVCAVAQRLGRRGIGIDLRYQDLAVKRIAILKGAA